MDNLSSYIKGSIVLIISLLIFFNCGNSPGGDGETTESISSSSGGNGETTESMSSSSVSSEPQEPPAVTALSIAGGSVVNLGSTLTLTATVTAVSGASEDVTWTSSDTTKATVSASGVVTGVSAGDVRITATSDFDSTKNADHAVTVASTYVFLRCEGNTVNNNVHFSEISFYHNDGATRITAANVTNKLNSTMSTSNTSTETLTTVNLSDSFAGRIFDDAGIEGGTSVWDLGDTSGGGDAIILTLQIDKHLNFDSIKIGLYNESGRTYKQVSVSVGATDEFSSATAWGTVASADDYATFNRP